jgi:hypothetical protein
VLTSLAGALAGALDVEARQFLGRRDDFAISADLRGVPDRL